MSRQFCHSEADAAKCWCPLVRAEWSGGVEPQYSTNRYFQEDAKTVDPGVVGCIASRCMAWRWVDTHVPDETGEPVKSQNTHGYCGLAGQPWESRS